MFKLHDEIQTGINPIANIAEIAILQISIAEITNVYVIWRNSDLKKPTQKSQASKILQISQNYLNERNRASIAEIADIANIAELYK